MPPINILQGFLIDDETFYKMINSAVHCVAVILRNQSIYTEILKAFLLPKKFLSGKE